MENTASHSLSPHSELSYVLHLHDRLSLGSRVLLLLLLREGMFHSVRPVRSSPCFRCHQVLRLSIGHPAPRSSQAKPAVAHPKESVLSEVASNHPRLARVVLKKGKAQLFRDGHPMLYGGAVDRVVGRPPPELGDTVLVTDGAEQPIGWGVYNPVSMFRVRIMQMGDDAHREPDCVLNMEELIHSRINSAVDLRRRLGLPSANTSVYRLVNSEGDRLSGLIVDVLGQQVVVASSAAWAERYRTTIEHAIGKATQISNVTWRPSVEILKEEGFEIEPSCKSLSHESRPLDCSEVVENGIRYRVSLGGQKTGFYADQRDSRLLLRSLANQSSVLDLCCYSGGFALNAAVGGALHTTGVDSSVPALELAKVNASLNGVDVSVINFVKADVGEYMKSALMEGKSWDVVVLDPPKLAPSRKVLPRAATKYRNLNAMAMQLTKRGGLLMTCSCSGAMTQSGKFVSVLQEAALRTNRHLTQLRHAGAAPDHTQNPAYPEGAYLTNVLVRVE